LSVTVILGGAYSGGKASPAVPQVTRFVPVEMEDLQQQWQHRLFVLKAKVTA